jgi:hypothetical protein
VDNGEAIGRIVLRNGRIRHAQIDKADGTAEALPVPKSIYRMLTWEHGVFELDPPTIAYPDSAELTVQEVLMEGFRQKDELAELQAKLPKSNGKLSLVMPLDAPLRDLEPRELDTLQLAINKGNLDAVMATSSLTDLEIARILLKLLSKNYIKTT